MDSIIHNEVPAEEGFVLATCRTCKNRTDQMQSVFEVMDNCIISEMIMACTSIQISDSDNLPKFICKLCIEQLKNAHSFKMQCEAADASFRSYLDRCVKKENDAFTSQTDQNPVSMDCLLPPDNVNVNDKSNVSTQPPLDKNVDFVELQDDKVIFTCRECLKVYYSIESLRAHKHSVHLGYTYKCKDCNKEFSRSSSLRYHRLSHESRKTYVCRICKQSLSRLEHLRRHLLVHLKDKPYNCEQCQRGFTRQERLALHLPKCTGVKGYTCDICNKCCLREAGLMEHRKLHVNAEPTMLTMEDLQNYANYYDVFEEHVDLPPLNPGTSAGAADSDSDGNDDCDFHDASDYEMSSDTHTKAIDTTDEKSVIKTEEKIDIEDIMIMDMVVEEKERERPQKAKKGPKKKLKRGAKKEPVPMDEPLPPLKKFGELKKYKCSECGLVYTNRRMYEKHARQAHSKLLHKCNICAKEFCREDNFKRHLKFHSSAKVKTFNCDICQKKYGRSEHLKRHQKVHEKKPVQAAERKFECPVCAKVFTTEKYRDVHAKGHTGEKTFVCPTCAKSFLSKSHLNEHMKFHDDNCKKFLCSECGQRFVRNDFLVIHMRRHRGEKPYKCQYCGKGFARCWDLTVHERYHTGEKKHLCIVCGKGFTRAHSLTIHMRTHTGEKPYKCQHCDAAFAQSNDLKAHTRRHTGERFQCELCTEKFLMGYLLTQHKRTVHGLDVVSHNNRLKLKVGKNQDDLSPTKRTA